MSQPYKACPRCQQPANLQDAVCQHCGHIYRTRFTDRTQMFTPQTYAQPAAQPNVLLIFCMWATSVVSWFCMFFSPPFGLFIDLISLVCAVFLVTTDVPTNKWNGWIKIGLEGFGFVCAFMASFMTHYRGY